MTRITTGLALAFAAASSHAHGGHGHAGAHWHATDTFGLLLVGALAAAAIWLARK
ncbi:MAG: hypothetical protein HY854_19450 [Burkholderiales bacterium]|nr:hypothetical protein [Burkholderiales bacterium]